MKKLILGTFLIASFLLPSYADSEEGKKQIECPFTDEPIKIDGTLDDQAWRKAVDVKLVIPVTNEEPISKTEAKILWDDNYFYVGFKAYDKDIFSYYTERDSITCDEDVLEVFIKPDLEKDPYYNFEINALNTVYDAFNVKQGAGGSRMHRWKRWDCQGLKSAVTVKGAMNNWEVIDEYWQLEVAIPFADLPSLKEKTPAPGDIWLFHLARYDYSVHLPKGVETSSSARFTKFKFHYYEDWSRLRFVK